MARLLVMAKAPVPGEGKTRLRLDPEDAARLQRALILDTVTKARSLRPTTLAGAPPERLDLISPLLPPDVRLIAQSAGDLGERMLAGVKTLFAESPEPVLLLGTDAPTLPPEYIRHAVRALESGTHDASIIGSTDGGYVLLGLRKPYEALFSDVPWSTGQVYRWTLENAREAGIRLYEVGTWYDVDDPEDLEHLAKELARDPEPAPRVAALLGGLSAGSAG